MTNDEAFRLMGEHGISIEYDGSYVNAWCDDADVTLEFKQGDRVSATKQAIEMILDGAGKRDE